MDRHPVGGSQRIGNHDDSHAALAHTGQKLDALLSRHEVRRDEEQLALRLIDDLAQLRGEMRLRLVGGSGHLVRMVFHDRGLSPVVGNASIPDLSGKFTVAQALRVGRSLRGFMVGDECRPLCGELLGRRVLSRQRGDRNRRLVVPIKIEFVGHLLHHGADEHHVEIGKIHLRMRLEIFIADIAAADDGGLPVGGERLVVHPLIDAPEVGDHAEQAGRTQGHGVEHAHLDVRMTVDGEQRGVGGHRAEIVEQQAHAHAAVGRPEQMLKQDFARHVLVPDEILHIETALRRIRQGQPRGQGLAPVQKCVEAGLPRMRCNTRTHRRRQRRAPVVFHGRGRRALADLGKAAARTE